MKHWISGPVVAALATWLGMAASAVADARPLDLDVKKTDVGASGNTEAASQATGDKAANNSQCAALESNINADVGDIIRAGCKPTTAQMSKLMDNPLGNVAMLFTQFDLYKLKNPENGKTDEKINCMGIAQFPKGLGENWNLINRIVWNVPSMPIDQSKIDDAQRAAADFGSSQGATLPPAGSPIAPIDVFGGRTTGFGDMYYVGLFSPKKPIDMGNGKFVWGAGFDLMAPTASEEILGTGKWGAGPSALGVYLGKSGSSVPWRSSTGPSPATATGTTSI